MTDPTRKTLLIRVGAWLRGALGKEDDSPHPLVPAVRLDLDRQRTLRFTMTESVEFRRRTGISIFREGLNLYELDEEQFLELLTVMASHDDSEVTAGDLAPYVYSERVTDVLAAMSLLLAEFQPPTPEGMEENPLVASALSHLGKRSTGRSPRRRSESESGSSGA